jgi:hypothetical protein
MYKNWRIGRIVRTYPARNPASLMVKVDVLEKCYDNGGEEYVAKYQINLLVNKENLIKIVRSIKPGQPVLVGFYAQSFDPNDDGTGYTVLALKAIEPVEPQDMELIATSIWASQRDPVSYVDEDSMLGWYSGEEQQEYD